MKPQLESMYRQWLKVRVSYQTEQESIEAVKRNGDALQYVEDRWFEHLAAENAVRTVSKAEIAEKFGITSDFEIVD